MNHVSMTVLIGLVGWTLLLVIVMEALRARLIMTGAVAVTALKPDNANLSPFMQRLARAHANCVESLPVLATLLIAALVADRAAVTDPLAPWLLAARVAQSCAHLASSGAFATNARFAFFVVQVAIAVYWICALLAG
jgi:hypothetical protein